MREVANQCTTRVLFIAPLHIVLSATVWRTQMKVLKGVRMGAEMMKEVGSDSGGRLPRFLSVLPQQSGHGKHLPREREGESLFSSILYFFTLEFIQLWENSLSSLARFISSCVRC